MDRMLNPRIEKQTIYEIYRACRLCGAGAGYKMPIMQNVVDLDRSEVDLKQKIRECVQIEVHQDDKMPPLICELCVDKVNDFYEFLDMCRRTNKKTRLRLGLPLQTVTKGSSDSGGDCILGMTEPVYIIDDSDSGEPLSKHKSKTSKKTNKKDVHKIDKPGNTRSRSNKREPTPPRLTRFSRGAVAEDRTPLTRIKSQQAKPQKSILKKDVRVKIEDSTSLLTPRLKRSRERDSKYNVPVKRVKIAIKSPSPPPKPKKSSPKVTPKPSKHVPTPTYSCGVCKFVVRNTKGLASHMRIHTVTYTNPKLACNACGEWFNTSDETATHHRRHRTRCLPYHCRRCTADFKQLNAFEDHFSNNECVPEEVVPDVKCGDCWRMFPTATALEGHRCPGEDGRVGGKCSRCNKNYALLRNLRRHEATCNSKKKERELVVDPVLLGRLRPIRVRVARCDPLLANVKQEHYDVSTVSEDFGLDSNCFYPYISSVRSLRIKSEPNEFDGMVNIKDEIKEEFCADHYVHWDSSSDSEVEETCVLSPAKKPLESLARLSLKTLFSQKCLGKVPRKKRKVKAEKFDASTSEFDMSKNIDSIINNFSDDDDFGGRKDVVRVNNDMFDDLFKNNDSELDGNKDGHDSSTVIDKVIDDAVCQDKEADNIISNDNVVVECVSSDRDMTASSNETEGTDILSNVTENVDGISNENKINDISNTLKSINEVTNDTSPSNDRKSEDDDNNSQRLSEDVDMTETCHKDNDDTTIADKERNNDNDTINDVEMTDINDKHDEIATVNNVQVDDKNTKDNILNNNDREKDTAEDKLNVRETEDKEIDTSNDKQINYSNHDSSNDNDITDESCSNAEVLSEKTSESIQVDEEIVANNNSTSESDAGIETEVRLKEGHDDDAISTSHDETLDKVNNSIETNHESVKTKENILGEDISSENKNVSPRKLSDEDNKSNTQQDNARVSNNVQTNEAENLSSDVQNNDTDSLTNNSDSQNSLVNGSKSEMTEDEEMDDKKLMEALDAQIGESPEGQKQADDSQSNEAANIDIVKIDSKDEKITLEDLISKKDAELQSMDLDNISDDEFNFDV